MVNYKELVEFIVKRLVTQPDDVEVEVETKEGKGVIKNREEGSNDQRYPAVGQSGSSQGRGEG